MRTGLAARRAGLLLLLSLTGCFRVNVIMPGVAPQERHARWVNGFLWGAIGGTVNAGELCGGRPVAEVKTHRSFGNLFVYWLTLGLYSPSRLVVTCGVPYGSPGYGLPPTGPPGAYLPPTQ